MNIIINKSIQEKANKIIADKKRKEQEVMANQYYIDLCIKASICPVCGDELTSRKASKKEKEEYYYDYFNNTLECNKQHYKLVTGENFTHEDEA